MEWEQSLNGQVASHATLVAWLHQYARPNDKISDLLASGQLIALRRGLYALPGESAPPRELVANHLFGPSYVSRHWALAYYGMLTESVTRVSSVCVGRSRQYVNALGTFSYFKLPQPYYATGITIIRHDRSAYMMAEPEKALCDLLVSTRNLRIQSRKAMLTYLLEELRLDEDSLAGLRIEQVALHARAGFKSTLLNYLVSVLNSLATEHAYSDTSRAHPNVALRSGRSPLRLSR